MSERINQMRGLFGRRRGSVRAGRVLIVGAALTSTGQMLQAAPIAGPTDVTSITTQFVSGPVSTVNPDKGTANTGTYSGFVSANTYNVSYAGVDDKILSVTGGGVTYSATGMATSVTRRITGTSANDNDQLWFVGSGTATNKSSLKINGPGMTGFSQAFDANNLYVGADNIFSNTGNPVGDNSNVMRVDLLFGAFKASNLSAFTVFDRGVYNDHDSFKVAAITAVDANGNPSNYGPLLSFSDGTWGKTYIMNPTEELILRKNDSSASNPFQPADMTTQGLGGEIIPTSSLVTAGTTIYGYSIFSADVTGKGTELAQWTNTTYFPLANSSSTGGGLDPAATVAVLYTASPAAVPEPASLGIAALVGAGLLGRRRRAV